MANPFYVEPASPLKALMLGQQAYGDARKRTQEDEAKVALQQFAQSNPQLGPLAQLIGAGPSGIQAAQAVSNIELARSNQAFRQSESTREQQNSDRTFGLKQQELNRPQYKEVTNPATGEVMLYEIRPGQAPRIYQPGMNDSGAPYDGTPPTTPVIPSGQQATEGITGAQIVSGPGAGLDVTPRPAQPQQVAQAPQGAHIPTWHKEQTKARVEADSKTAELQKGGEQVLRMVDQLEAKVRAPQFGEATGPFVGAASDDAIWSPQRWAYEAYQSREAKAFLDRVRSDAQAINSSMQRALLKGGGQITENERTEINKILGSIMTARSPEDAKAQLDNFRIIVRKMFGMPEQRLRYNPQIGDFE